MKTFALGFMCVFFCVCAALRVFERVAKRFYPGVLFAYTLDRKLAER